MKNSQIINTTQKSGELKFTSNLGKQLQEEYLSNNDEEEEEAGVENEQVSACDRLYSLREKENKRMELLNKVNQE